MRYQITPIARLFVGDLLFWAAKTIKIGDFYCNIIWIGSCNLYRAWDLVGRGHNKILVVVLCRNLRQDRCNYN